MLVAVFNYGTRLLITEIRKLPQLVKANRIDIYFADVRRVYPKPGLLYLHTVMNQSRKPLLIALC